MDNVRAQILLAQQGDEKVLEKLVEDNSGLIWSIVKKFTGRGIEAEDLFQLGAIGLIKCIRKFDLSYNVKLSTYAVPMIMGEIKRFLRDDGKIKVSRTLRELSVRAKIVGEELEKKLGREADAKEIAKELGVGEDEVIMALEAGREVESLDDGIYKNAGRPENRIDRLASGDESESIDNRIILRQAIEALDPRDREIIKMRYYEDKTQTEVSKTIGVSQVQISRLEKKILKTIKESFSV